MAVAASLWLCAGPAAAQTAKPWRHGLIEAKSDAGFFWMVGRGFAEKQWIKLEIVQFKTDFIALQAMLAGEIDSFDGGPVGSIIAASRGGDVKLIGCEWPGLPYGIFVRGNIASPADLKSKTLAARHDEAVRFMAALIAAFRHAVAHRDETVSLTRAIASIKPDDPRPEFVFDDAVKTRSVDPEYSLPLEKLGWMSGQLVKDGTLKQKFDVAKAIDPAVRAAALQAIDR